MWQLWRDQLERHKWKVVGFAALAVCFVLSFLLVPASDARPRRASQGIASFGFYSWVFWGGWVGVSFTIADRRGLRVIRVLPVRSHNTARAWWFGATITPVLVGVLTYALLLVVSGVTQRAVSCRSTRATSSHLRPWRSSWCGRAASQRSPGD
jgi:hypothetical protein